ncbi:unnamed protein product, partial [Protopolystoma xenopodis]
GSAEKTCDWTVIGKSGQERAGLTISSAINSTSLMYCSAKRIISVVRRVSSHWQSALEGRFAVEMVERSIVAGCVWSSAVVSTATVVKAATGDEDDEEDGTKIVWDLNFGSRVDDGTVDTWTHVLTNHRSRLGKMTHRRLSRSCRRIMTVVC